MEISSIISNLRSATVTTKSTQLNEVTQHKKNNEITQKTTKNQEICDKADISNEALALLKNECETKANTKQAVNNTNIYNNVKNTDKSGYLYKKALKGYSIMQTQK